MRDDRQNADPLEIAARRARAFLASLPGRPIAPAADAPALRARLATALPDGPSAPAAVIAELAEALEPGLLASAAPRFFGWVIGGTLPAAIAADWLTSAWDQNGAAYALSPAAAVAEEVAGAWLKEIFGLPAEASFALVSGCQMAHVTALAAARHHLLAARGIDVERTGLHEAPRFRILLAETRHESLLRAIRLLGFGLDSITLLRCSEAGSLEPAALAEALAEDGRPSILCLQAGELNTGAFDPFIPAIALARAAGAWVHVDGAFGLWAAASGRFRPLLAGVEGADSWACDGHKWLNLPQDCGFAFTAHPASHRAAFAQTTGYALLAEDTRRALDWNPEWSRRARAFVVLAALRSLGRRGLAGLVEQSCTACARLATGIAALPGAALVAAPIINQALVRFRDPAGRDDDARTEAVAAVVREEGEAWFGTALWRGRRVMRISVVNWRTDLVQAERAVAAVARALARLDRGAAREPG